MRFFVLGLFGALLAGAESRPSPRVLLDAGDLERIEALCGRARWAGDVRDGIVRAAADWPASHSQRYGLAEWRLPPDGGQWTLWYVCPRHGVSLTFRPPDQHICPVDNERFTGWPYDEVIYARRHNDNASAARDNGLAFRLSGRMEFALAAKRILLAYADAYLSYPIKDTNNRPDARSGGRVGAQTLDEAVWLIPVAWAYDLIASSCVLDASERAHIERDLLRAAVQVIRRNDAGQSNWQSWHNAAVGAAGFALDDAGLVAQAIDGPSGFRFQMRESVFEDGLWYEGAWGYHFYALEPLWLLAEMGAHNGFDLYAEWPLRKMFEAPLKFALPDWSLAPFNDSRSVSILGYDRFYEVAWRRYDDPLFAALLGRAARPREALLWGAESLPRTPPPALESEVFTASGNALLRAPGSDHVIAFKFGPHGGWHGHYDKLSFVSFARGGTMAVDPGTQSYAAPTHNTWDKVTVAHNTVVVDEKTQREAAGRLLAFATAGPMTAVRASAGEAYREAALERTLFLAPEYAVDAFTARSVDGQQHRFDWVYHNDGQAASPLRREPYKSFPSSNGYQHLVNTGAAVTAADWQALFDMNANLLGNYGSTYVNDAAIQATSRYSRERAASGLFSARLGYNFRGAPGYIVFSTPVLAGHPDEAPTGVTLKVCGDGSRHKLAIRLYDATDERFVTTVGPVDWTGWREITVAQPAQWSHYLGNDNGRIDTPIRSVALELTSVAGAPPEGALFVDDIAVEYPSAGRVLVADFERLLRSLRLWMLGAEGTTVVLGDGLGPNLLQPVPFAMARRRGTEARFFALLEPYGETPRISGFRSLSENSFEVTAADFQDVFSLDAKGNLSFTRTAR